jgi:hypothetical protein
MLALKGFLFAVIASAESECSMTDPDGDLCLLQLNTHASDEKVKLMQADEEEIELHTTDEESLATVAPSAPLMDASFVACFTYPGKKVSNEHRLDNRVDCPGEAYGYATVELWPSPLGFGHNHWNHYSGEYKKNCMNVEDMDHCQALCATINAPVSFYRHKGSKNGANNSCGCYTEVPTLKADSKDDFEVRDCTATVQ